MRRSRFKVGCFAGAVVAMSMGWACFPHPDDDFEDYQKRVAEMPKPVIEASTFEAAPPPTETVEGLFYGACLCELAFSDMKKVFNLYTLTKFTPSTAGGGKLELSVQSLLLATPPGPPATVVKSGTVGDVFPATADVDSAGRYTLKLGAFAIPGKANPISGSDALIENATVQGRFSADGFCGRLGGHIAKPEAVARDLDPTLNICQFVPVKDGDPTPELNFADFQAESCPVD